MKQSKKLFDAINDANKVLIIPSTPVDGDSLGSAIALHLWIKKLGKDSELMSFRSYSEMYPNRFPNGNLVKHVDFLSVDYSQFDIIIILDGSGWFKAIGENFEQILNKMPLEKIFLIDHHESGSIAEAIGDRAVVVQSSATAEVLYRDFFEFNKIEIDKEIASYLYFAQVYDTERFKFISDDTYQIAQELHKYGIDHNKIVDFRVSEESFRFTGWAIQHSLIFPFIQTMILPVYNSDLELLISMFGENWMEKDLDNFYKAHFLRNINGHSYGFTLIAIENGKTELRWRTSNTGVTLSIADVLNSIEGMGTVGGHRNAGGGVFDGSVSDAIKSITSEMENQLKRLHSKDKKDKEWINYSQDW